MRIKDLASYRAVALLLCAMLWGCSEPPNTSGMAEQVADNYYQSLKNKDFDKAAAEFADTPGEPRAKWRDQLRDYNSKLGDLQSYQFLGKEVDTVFTGTRYILRYKTQYSKFPATEMLIVFEGVSSYGGENGMQIQGVIVKSKGL